MITITSFVTFFFISVLAICVKILHDESASSSYSLIVILNVVFPYFCIEITNLELHKNISDVQTSLFVKIALFRWVNTVILIDIITPFVNKLSDATIRSDDAALIPA